MFLQLSHVEIQNLQRTSSTGEHFNLVFITTYIEEQKHSSSLQGARSEELLQSISFHCSFALIPNMRCAESLASTQGETEEKRIKVSEQGDSLESGV
jgi:hypothetical protein